MTGVLGRKGEGAEEGRGLRHTPEGGVQRLGQVGGGEVVLLGEGHDGEARVIGLKGDVARGAEGNDPDARAVAVRLAHAQNVVLQDGVLPGEGQGRGLDLIRVDLATLRRARGQRRGQKQGNTSLHDSLLL